MLYEKDRSRAQNLPWADGSPSLKSDSFFRDDLNTHIHSPTSLLLGPLKHLLAPF